MRGYSTHSIFGNGYNSGNVKYAARDICRKAKLKMGMVFQNFRDNDENGMVFLC